jgi:hypothetical protein
LPIKNCNFSIEFLQFNDTHQLERSASSIPEVPIANIHPPVALDSEAAPVQGKDRHGTPAGLVLPSVAEALFLYYFCVRQLKQGKTTGPKDDISLELCMCPLTHISFVERLKLQFI